MTNKELIESTKEIVIAMLNSKFLTSNVRTDVNKEIAEALKSTYTELVELNSKDITETVIVA